MPRSTYILGMAGLIGVPIWLLPDARQTLGSEAFLALSALSIAGAIVGLATWYMDGE